MQVQEERRVEVCVFCVGGGESGRYIDELLDRYLYTNRNESHKSPAFYVE